MHCNKCGSKDTETVKCPNCKQNSSIKCKGCGNQYCSDRYCEVIALHAKRKQLTQIAIILFVLILCTVPSTFAVMKGAVTRATIGAPVAPPPPQQAKNTPPKPAPGTPPKPTPPVQTATKPPPPPPATPPPATPPSAPPSTTPPPPGASPEPPAATPPPPPAVTPPPPATPPPAPAKPSPEEQFGALDKAIQAGLGTPYKKDGSSIQDGGVDAPGYVQWIYSQVGHPEVTRDYGALAKVGAAVEGADYKPGDILLYSIKKDGTVSFAGLYWKDGKMTYPFPKERKVIEGEINSAFFKDRFVGARRVVQ